MSQTPDSIKEKIAHRDTVLHVRAVLATVSGKALFKYFFDSFGVGQFPAVGLENDFLRDELGNLRVGNSIFKLASEADFEIAGNLLAQLEKDRYDQLHAEQTDG